jgi:hypothetical protein
MKKPSWWTGSLLFKSILIWFAVFLVWLPVFTRWPDSIPARVLTLLCVACMLPLVCSYGVGIASDLVRLLARVVPKKRRIHGDE